MQQQQQQQSMDCDERRRRRRCLLLCPSFCLSSFNRSFRRSFVRYNRNAFIADCLLQNLSDSSNLFSPTIIIRFPFIFSASVVLEWLRFSRSLPV